jgi:regulator of RNase E activity RraA
MFDNKDFIQEITSCWDGERFANGRPKVSDSLLERFRYLSIEEIYGGIWTLYPKGYGFQFQSGFQCTHSQDTLLIGRAVTAMMMPSRVDLDASMRKIGEREGRKGFYNSWVIQTMQENDVLVVDMFDKVHEGTFVGGNLTTGIEERTGGKGGSVIWGGVRDLSQIREKTVPTFYRGYDPTAIMQVVMTGINVPCRIGGAVCLPGDLVFANRDGVMFVPPHLAETVAVLAEQTQVRDIFGFQRIDEKLYTVAQIDSPWTQAIWDDFLAWFKTETPSRYRHLVSWDDAIRKDLESDGLVRI